MMLVNRTFTVPPIVIDWQTQKIYKTGNIVGCQQQQQQQQTRNKIFKKNS